MTGPQAGDRISEYLLDELLGSGSFGQVWKAHHHIWKDTLVAIKIPTDSRYVRNLQKEGCTIHGLRHPNIVRALGLDPYADTPYLVMEYVAGRSLRQILTEHANGLPLIGVQNVLCGILRALEHAHQNGVIHRDIKPENILVAGADQKPIDDVQISDIKVTDFGLGRAGEITTSSILQSGSMLSEEGRSVSGTLAYMAPEQRDNGQTDEQSDLYSVGVVLYEMLCGQRPGGLDMPSHSRADLPAWVDLLYSRLYTLRERRIASATDALRILPTATVPPVIVPGHRTGGGRAFTAASSVCEGCGATLEVTDNFCIICGKQVVSSPRRCGKCGAFPSPEDRFCVFCGSRLALGPG